MDFEAFESDVMDALGDGFESDSAGDIGSGDPFYCAIGETWIGTLFGFEENSYGQRQTYLFDTEEARDAWFREVSASVGPSGV